MPSEGRVESRSLTEVIEAIWKRKVAQHNITADHSRVMLSREEVAYLLTNTVESGTWPEAPDA